MDTTHIPKIFWYSVSAAILIVTLTFSWAALQSRGMTIEIANARIAVTGQLGELEQRLAQLEREGNSNTTALRSMLETPAARISPPEVTEEALQKNAEKITDIRKSLLQQQIAR